MHALKFPLLLSYDFLREMRGRAIANMLSDQRFEFLVTCGAPMDSEELAEFASTMRDYSQGLFGYITRNADRLSMAAMQAAELSPIPVHELGEDAERMEELFKLSDYVALDGLKRPLRGAAPKNYIVAKTEWAKGRKVHWIGYAKPGMIGALRPFSCEASQSFSSGIARGRIALYMGRGKWEQFTREQFIARKMILSRNVLERLAHYQVPVECVLSELHWNYGDREEGMKIEQSALFRLPALGLLEFAMDIRQEFQTRLFTPFPPSLFTAIQSCATQIEKLQSNIAP